MKWVITIVIVLCLATLSAIPQLSFEPEFTKTKQALLNIHLINKVLLILKDDTGELPNGGSGLEALYVNYKGNDKWKGPYLRKKLKDPWGNDFIYKYPHQCAARVGSFALYSTGENGIDECMSGDDIYEKLE